jgi:pyruvate dehydrogenase E2 component (dihydrolipoamide acetyltransferase)
MVEDADDIAAFKDYVAEGGKPVEAPAASTAAPAAPAATTPAPATPAPAAPAASAPASSGSRVLASPAARVAAEERGVDLSQLTGTAPHNAICKADVMEAPIASAASAAATVKAASSGAPAPVKAAPAPAAGDYVDEPPSMMRQVIAKRLTESKQTIPHYYVTVEVQMDAIVALRAQLNKQLAQQAQKSGDEPVKLSVNDFVIKAAAAALKKVPQVNCSWQDTFVRNYNYVDISVAVSTDAGLITPIIADADLKGLAGISAEMKSLAKKARQNKLQPHEFVGGTFTISNLGMFGVKEFSAIINPPQAGILAIGSSDQKVIANPDYTTENGQSPFKTVSVMNATCSYDHRVVDGAVGAQWLQAFKEFCENPIKLLL